MNIKFKPHVGVGPLKFGMSKSEVKTALKTIHGIEDCSFKDGKLCSFSIYPDEFRQLFFAGKNVLKMGRLSVALFFTEHSNDYGQAQGGSLYYTDLGFAILQFESSIREFVFFSREYDTHEPLKEMSPVLIKEYYEEQTCDE